MRMKLEMEKLVIRPLRKEDLEEVIRIDREYTGRRREEYYKRLMKEILEPEYALITSLAAEYEGKLVGFIAGVIFSGEFGIPENIAYLTTIGVDKKFEDTYKAAGVELVYMTAEDHAAWIEIAKKTSHKAFAEKVAGGAKLMEMALAVK